MDPQQIIDEKIYPIQPRWLITSTISTFIVLSVLLTFYFISAIGSNGSADNSYLFYIALYFIGIPIGFIIKILTRANFHYSFDNTYLNVKSGILSKQVRNTPYGIIQNIVVKQGIFDRVFGLATLRIENAAEAGGQNISSKQYRQQQVDTITSSGNVVMIPGLNKADAETLKNILQEKMKLNPIVERGL